MSVSVVINKNNFPTIAARFPQAVDEITTLYLFKVHEAADPNTPRDTGDLANNVVVTPSRGGRGGQVHWSMEYAAYVNGGTIFQAPQPFATDAANLIRPAWVTALGQIESKL